MKKIAIFTSHSLLITVLGLCCSGLASFGYASNHVIVTLKNNPHPFTATSDAASTKKIASRKKQVKAKLQSNNIQENYVYSNVLYGFSAYVDDQQLAALHTDPDVEAITPSTTYRLFKKNPEDLSQSLDDFLDEREKDRDDRHPLIDFPQYIPTGPIDSGADNLVGQGAGQHIYIVDTGVDVNHKDIVERLGTSFAPLPCQHVLGKEVCVKPFSDDHSHGTHVAGTALASDNRIGVLGMAPEATLHAIKVCNASGSCSLDNIIAGLDWAVQDMNSRGNQPAVMNLSLGGQDRRDPGSCNASGYKGNNIIAKAYCHATHQGLIIVVAAGNSAKDAKDFAPAKYDSTITVSSYKRKMASTEIISVEYSSFSNWGTGSNDWSNRNSGVITLAAPGSKITSLNRTHGYIQFSGTSMASPAVAGASALVLEQFPQKKDFSAFVEVRKLLVENAHIPTEVINTDFPHKEGLLNVRFLK